MARTVKIITDKDARILRDQLRAFKRLPVNRRPTDDAESAFTRGEDHQAPEVYVAKAPEDGLPSLTEGTGSGLGTAEPGSAECELYHIREVGDVIKLFPMAQQTRLVYNLTATSLTGYFLAIRDKWGQWFAAAGGGGAFAVGNDRELIVETTLTSLIDEDVMEMEVDDHAQFPTDYGFVGQIDDELILFKITHGNTIWNIQERGFDGTTPASHVGTSTVTLVVPAMIQNVTQLLFHHEMFVHPDAGAGTVGDGTYDPSRAIVTNPVAICQTGTGSGSGYWDGSRQRFNTADDLYEDMQDIWIRDLARDE